MRTLLAVAVQLVQVALALLEVVLLAGALGCLRRAGL